MRIAALLFAASLAYAAEGATDIDSLLRTFNESVRKPDLQSLKALFTTTADYRDGAGTIAGRDAVADFFAKRGPWSERTPPVLEQRSVKLVGLSVALVDANVVQYGSMGKSALPVFLVLENQEGVWRIASWRGAGCAPATDLPR